MQLKERMAKYAKRGSELGDKFEKARILMKLYYYRKLKKVDKKKGRAKAVLDHLRGHDVPELEIPLPPSVMEDTFEF